MHLITIGRTTPSSNPPDERSAHRRENYLWKLNTHKPQTSIPTEEFEPATPASQQATNLRISQHSQRHRLTYFWLLFIIIQTQLCQISTFDSYHQISPMILCLKRRKLPSDHKLLFPQKNSNPQPQHTNRPQTYGLGSTANVTGWHISGFYLSLSRHSCARIWLSTLITRWVLWSYVWNGENFRQISKALCSFRSDSWKGTVKAVAGINETDNRRTGTYQAKLSAVNRDTGWRGEWQTRETSQLRPHRPYLLLVSRRCC